MDIDYRRKGNFLEVRDKQLKHLDANQKFVKHLCIYKIKIVDFLASVSGCSNRYGENAVQQKQNE